MLNKNQFLHVVVGLVFDEKNHILIACRPTHVVSPGFWEFPGGKVEANETLENALIREFREEIGIEVKHTQFFLKVEREYPEKILVLHVFRIDEFEGVPEGRENQEIRFIALDELKNYAFLPANAEIIRSITS